MAYSLLMEKYLEPMAVGIASGIVSGILTAIIIFWAVRFWSNHNIKSLHRRIKESEAEKVKLDNLAKSDRALIILGFQGVFLTIAILCMVLILHVISYVGPDFRKIIPALIWCIPAIVCIVIVNALERIADYPKSIERIEQRIATLRDRLTGK